MQTEKDVCWCGYHFDCKLQQRLSLKFEIKACVAATRGATNVEAVTVRWHMAQEGEPSRPKKTISVLNGGQLSNPLALHKIPLNLGCICWAVSP